MPHLKQLHPRWLLGCLCCCTNLVHYCQKVVTKNCNVSTNVHTSHNIKCIKICSVGLKLLYVEADGYSEANKHILQHSVAVVQKITNRNTGSFLSNQYHSAVINSIRYFCNEIVHDRFCVMKTLCFDFVFFASLFAIK